MTKKSNQVIYCSVEEKQWLKQVLEKKRASETLGVPIEIVIGNTTSCSTTNTTTIKQKAERNGFVKLRRKNQSA
jgi:hypothetical protein